MALSYGIITDQLDVLSLEIDLLDRVALEVELSYLSSETHLTSNLMDEKEVQAVFDDTNKVLKNVGKKVAVSLAQKYAAG